MIQFTEPLADAYVHPARNIMMPSTPGRQVRFLQGHAVIKHGRDMVAMMRREGVKLVLTPYAMNWAEAWFREAGEGIKAEILIPDDTQPTGWDSSMRSEIVGANSPDPDQGTQ